MAKNVLNILILLTVIISIITIPLISKADDGNHMSLNLKLVDRNYFAETGRSGVLSEYRSGDITEEDLLELSDAYLPLFVTTIRVDENEEITQEDKDTLMKIYETLEKNTKLSNQTRTDINTYKNIIKPNSGEDISSQDNVDNNDSLKKTISIITQEDYITYDKVELCSMTELSEIMNTTLLETTWESIPAENRIQYIKFLNKMSKNSELNKAQNENYLNYLNSRIATMEQTPLSEEEKAELEKVKENLKKRKESVDAENTTLVRQQIKEGNDYIFISPENTSSTDSSQDSIDNIIENAESFINLSNEPTPISKESLVNLSSQLYNILLTIGTAIAVIIGGIIGIKLMTSSAEDKAEVKKYLIPYIIGCLIVFGAFGIWKLVVTTIQNSTESAQAEASTGNSGNSEIADPSTRITFDRNLIILDPNRYNTSKINATVTPENKQLTWLSSNSAIVTVDNSGGIIARSVGSAIITAEIKIGENQTTSAKCNVIVMETNEIPDEAYIVSDISSKKANVSSFIASLDRMSKITEEDYKNKNGSNWLYINGGESNTFEEAQQKNNKRNNCAVYINWALKEIGVMKKNQRFWKASVELSRI